MPSSCMHSSYVPCTHTTARQWHTLTFIDESLCSCSGTAGAKPSLLQIMLLIL